MARHGDGMPEGQRPPLPAELADQLAEILAEALVLDYQQQQRENQTNQQKEGA